MQAVTMQPALHFPPLDPFLSRPTHHLGAHQHFPIPLWAFSLPTPSTPTTPATPRPHHPESRCHNRHNRHNHNHHQSPTLLLSPVSSPRPTMQTPTPPASAAYTLPYKQGLPRPAFTLPPIVVSENRREVGGTRSMPTTPTSTPPQSPTSEERRLRMGMKRKRAMSVHSTKAHHNEREAVQEAAAAVSKLSLMHEVKSEVTFPNGAQVATWKLNGPRYKRCKVTSSNGDTEWKRCQHCGTDSTPEWRTGPLGKGTLCNACGLRYRTKQREQTARQSSGNVPVSLLLNPTSSKKGRTNISNPMIWETKLSSFPAADNEEGSM